MRKRTLLREALKAELARYKGDAQYLQRDTLNDLTYKFELALELDKETKGEFGISTAKLIDAFLKQGEVKK